MARKAIFTICAKNYLAQALTLKESAKYWNEDVDFYIVLADKKCEKIEDLDLVYLEDSWCPKWKSMAFKYNVIEFSTAVKPFFFKKLFSIGYDKVAYLDPDTYVTSKLDYVFDNLDKYSMIVTPHVNNIENNFTGAVPEEELLFVGIYNLGFGAIANTDIGRKIVEWWCVRLQSKCYADKEDALHVDQKWIDFIPGFFPENILISHHFGLNVAVWNLHERELFLREDKYYVRDLGTNVEYPLLLFHFSGFDPFNDKVINRRHPRFGIDVFPSFEPIIQEYKKLEYKNGYNKYHPLTYDFDNFENGYTILPLHRRLFRVYESNFNDDNPFNEKGLFYSALVRNKMILKDKHLNFNLVVKNKLNKESVGTMTKIIERGLSLLKGIIGVKFYFILLLAMKRYSRLENQSFLFKI